jgi:hypothetical protein
MKVALALTDMVMGILCIAVCVIALDRRMPDGGPMPIGPLLVGTLLGTLFVLSGVFLYG